MPDLRVGHNKQRKLQQLEQHLLSGKQALETFTSAIPNSSCDKINRCVKVLGEMLELNSAFMQYVKDDAGLITDVDNLSKARSSIRM